LSEKVSLELTASEALVLFEFLSRFTSEDVLKLEDQAEKQVLWDLCASLESILVEPFANNYKELLERARVEVRDSVSELS
jgi:hypothetical protein